MAPEPLGWVTGAPCPPPDGARPEEMTAERFIAGALGDWELVVPASWEGARCCFSRVDGCPVCPMFCVFQTLHCGWEPG